MCVVSALFLLLDNSSDNYFSYFYNYLQHSTYQCCSASSKNIAIFKFIFIRFTRQKRVAMRHNCSYTKQPRCTEVRDISQTFPERESTRDSEPRVFGIRQMYDARLKTWFSVSYSPPLHFRRFSHLPIPDVRARFRSDSDSDSYTKILQRVLSCTFTPRLAKRVLQLYFEQKYHIHSLTTKEIASVERIGAIATV